MSWTKTKFFSNYRSFHSIQCSPLWDNEIKINFSEKNIFKLVDWHFFINLLYKHKNQMVCQIWRMWHAIVPERSNWSLNSSYTLAKITLELLFWILRNLHRVVLLGNPNTTLVYSNAMRLKFKGISEGNSATW